MKKDIRERLERSHEERMARAGGRPRVGIKGKKPWGVAPSFNQKPGVKKGTEWIVNDVDIRSLPPAERPLLTPERARKLSAMRKVHAAGPGRPISDKLRCFCGAMTLRRAIARNHNCEEPSLKEGI